MRPRLIIYPRNSLAGWSITTVSPVHYHLQRLPRFPVFRQNLGAAADIRKIDVGPLSGFASFVCVIGDFIEPIGEKSEKAGEYNSPERGRPEDSPNFLQRVQNILLILSAIASFLAFVSVLVWAYVSKRSYVLLLAPIPAYVWYCAVSHVKL